jgi:signal transduction histidine kinase
LFSWGEPGTDPGQFNIVHNIVTSMLGGQIDIHTEVGVGTVFTLTLPVIAPDARP